MASVAVPSLRAQPAPASAAPPTPRPGAPKLAIAVDSRSSFCYLPLTIAERLGYFAQEGIDVEVREFPDVAQSLHALQSGAAHVLSGPYPNTIALQARGQNLQSFVLQGRAPQVVVGVSLETMGHNGGVADLRGRRVGVMASECRLAPRGEPGAGQGRAARRRCALRAVGECRGGGSGVSPR
ncbi:ABC transporter substrate-binding protein [Hydrogenophaga sp. UC242_53]|uniref:ABC transporter substrate-binding protein n=1 Tax=Hydrogenophaga sp. UC242_53 TaxID=3350170 RepID=UPI0036D42E40